jgi:hypothetical protein
LNEEHQIQEDSDAAEDVAIDILQESDEIHRVDFFNYFPNLASLTKVVWRLLLKFPNQPTVSPGLTN